MKAENELVAFNEGQTNTDEVSVEIKPERKKLELVKEGQTITQKIDISPKAVPQSPPEVIMLAAAPAAPAQESERPVPYALFFSVALGFATLCVMQWWGYTQLSQRLSRIENIARSTQEKAVLEGLKQTVALMNQRLERLDSALAGTTGGRAASIATRKTKAQKKKKGRAVLVVDFSHG